MNDNKFEMHCIVELFGHQQIAGKVTEQSIGGATFIRVDVPKTRQRGEFTKFYGPGAIYAITPVEVSIAQAMAESLEVAPVAEWRLKSIDVSLQLPEGSSDDEDKRFFSDDDLAADELVEETEVMAHDDDKRAATRWARELLTGEFVILDTETTGVESDAEIIQIGIIDYTGAVVLERLIKPVCAVTNSEYHGITDEMLGNSPPFPEVYGQIKLALEGKTVVGYNVAYDCRMLEQVCVMHKLDVINIPQSWCVMEMYAQFNGEWNAYHGNYRWKKLREALAYFDLKHQDFGTKEHDACTDARATLALIKEMAKFPVQPKPEVKPDLPF